MIVSARNFLFFLITAGVLHIVVVLYEYYSQFNDAKQPNTPIPRYWRHKNKTLVWLSDMVVCKKNVTEPDLPKQTTTMFEGQSDIYEILCPLVAPDLGPVEKDAFIMNLRGIDDMNLRVDYGGIHVPYCIAQQRVAVVIAVHETDVGGFMFYIHPFLMKQQLEYQIFVIRKMTPEGPFERGKLFNIGFVEAQAHRNGSWDCFVFHDVNVVPLDTRNLYRCGRRPKRLVADFRKPYRFGGAVAILPQDFTRVDGFSNRIWSNDGDYINMYRRLKAANLSIESNSNHIGSYTTIDFLNLNHSNRSPQKSKIQNKPGRNLTLGSSNLKDGLSNLFYNSIKQLKQFYTLIEVKSTHTTSL